MGEHAAAVDVGHQNDGAIHRFGIPHVGDVVGAQIDLGRAAGTFHQHHIEALDQALMRGQYRLECGCLVGVIAHRIQRGDRLPVHDHLRTSIAVGLEQYRIEIGLRIQPACLCLQCLRAADFATVHRHCRIQRHVLRLEWRHRNALAMQPPAQRGHQRALARIGGAALHHQHACAHASTCRRAASRRASPAASGGRPKRRLDGVSNSRVKMPRCANATCKVAASSRRHH